MKKTAFIFSTSDLFSVYSQLALSSFYECQTLNMRYANEYMNKDEFFIQQIKELFNQEYYEKGLLNRQYEYTFTSQLAYRIDELFEAHKPSIVFFEMKTMSDAEWSTLHHLHERYQVPVAVFLEADSQDEQIVFRLLNTGVREMIPRLEDSFFTRIAKRNVNSRSN